MNRGKSFLQPIMRNSGKIIGFHRESEFQDNHQRNYEAKQPTVGKFEMTEGLSFALPDGDIFFLVL